MVMIHGRATDAVPQFVSGFSTMNKWLNFSQLICFNNVKGLKEYCMRWCSHATDVVLLF